MIDQAITAYHQALAGYHSPAFLQFIKENMDTNSEINGIYDLSTKLPTVDYESPPAVYGFLIWYCLELNERELAQRLYEQMLTFRNHYPWSRYYGGFTVGPDGNTHIFDNLVPLIAETRLLK
ncbi:hypothetical protein JCM21714_3746 [Gracilibacillus boraciitolerans JCM 21714]|uniref:Uncharacterized protein n=1 Tax=Gracilibacillus boraciitolerans JCM 21714 TaxID=1298598 RepID=W4VMF6_9BACI|nr:hypothetical protein [Gracilibacillus boraciitolerans]GAE94575.1 hypothetical protein JCM21714_3746 [Gracilibacillus boraciitolerans JCM 21714]